MLTGTVSLMQKLPSLSTVLQELRQEATSSENEERSAQILAKATVMCVAAFLAKKKYRKEAGLALTYRRLLQPLIRTLLGKRPSGASISYELRRLLATGPQRYYQESLSQLAALYPQD